MTSNEMTSLVLLDENSLEQAMVRLQNGDRFFVAIADAARACRALDHLAEFSEQFKRLFEVLKSWVAANRQSVKSAYLSFRERDILLLVMQKGEAFDSNLADSLTELDLAIANNQEFNLLAMNVLSIPAVSDASTKAFLASGKVFRYAD